MIWHWKSKCDHPLMTTMTRAWRMMMYITGEQGEQGASWENRVCGKGRSHPDASKIRRTESQQRFCHWHRSPGGFSLWRGWSDRIVVQDWETETLDIDMGRISNDDDLGLDLAGGRFFLFSLLGWRKIVFFLIGWRKVVFFLFNWLAEGCFFSF